MKRFSRGQVAIEFVIIVTISLVYLVGVVFPNAQKAQFAAEDSTRLSLARQALDQIAGAVYEADANPGDSKRSLEIIVPENTRISCHESTGIAFSANLEPSLPLPAKCQAGNPIPTPPTPPSCAFTYSFAPPNVSTAVSCTFGSFDARSNRFKQRVTVEKTNGQIQIG